MYYSFAVLILRCMSYLWFVDVCLSICLAAAKMNHSCSLSMHSELTIFLARKILLSLLAGCLPVRHVTVILCEDARGLR